MYNTQRLILKPFTKKDLPAFQTIMADPRIGAWLAKPEGFSPETSRMMLERFQNHWKNYGYGTFGVFEKETENLLGYCGLKFDERFGAPKILYALDADYWGMGYISEAGKKVLEVAANEWDIDKVVSFTLPNNLASQAVMKKLGLVYSRNIIHADLDHVFFERSLR
ncbi:MAG: GNAT family N-acetyltransferase [Bacteroidia bacterium]